MVLIFVNRSSPRLQYIAAFIFKELIKIPYSITSHQESFKKFDGVKINYTTTKVADDELYVNPVGLLSETGISEQQIETFETGTYTAFFKSLSQQEDHFPFDIFSASFYLISRYEEYLPYEAVKFGRYPHTESLGFKNNFLNVPLINIWVDDFASWLKQKHPALTFHKLPFKFIPTYDIDIAYSYLNKGILRNAGAAIRSAFTLNVKSLVQRVKVLIKKENDPFDNYNWLDRLHQQFNLEPIYFFLVAEKNGLYDKNVLPDKIVMQDIIKEHAKKYTIGLHPSWQSGDDKSLIAKEKETLEKISDTEIDKSRQHYLRMKLPETYRLLIEAQIKEEYSMGYGTINGFRASVASSFYWYDIENEFQTKLRVHPFCYMDSNSIYQQKMLPQQGYDEMVGYHKICKQYSGTFISIIHNHLIAGKEWKNVYEKFLLSIAKED